MSNESSGRTLSKGVEIRARMDLEVGRSLVLINGAGIIALLTFLASILTTDRYILLAKPTIIGVGALVFGLMFALLYIRTGRKCSLVYEQNGMKPPPGQLFSLQLTQPRICAVSGIMMYLSGLSFCAAGAIVAVSWWRLL